MPSLIPCSEMGSLPVGFGVSLVDSSSSGHIFLVPLLVILISTRTLRTSVRHSYCTGLAEDECGYPIARDLVPSSRPFLGHC